MGYEAHSPVKQVWLPLNKEWIVQVASGGLSFGDFAKLYKEKYGIDLHDILELHVDGDEFQVISKVDLLGAYNVPTNDSEYALNSKMAQPNAIRNIESWPQPQSEPSLLMVIGLADHSEAFFVGFTINLPAVNTTISSIDVLLVRAFEI